MLGMSETFTAHSAEPLDVRLPPKTRPGSSGRAVDSYERRIVDPETARSYRPARSASCNCEAAG